MIRIALLAATALVALAPAAARSTLDDHVAAALASAGPGTRFGLLVTTMEGKEVVAVNPDDRFVPASNTKLFTTAAVFASGIDLAAPDTAGATVRIDGGDVVLTGHGDARMSAAADCTDDCLATLADAVAAKTRRVRDVIGDDTLFPDERWSPGMSWNNIPTTSGTGISALTLDDNELAVSVLPGNAAGATATIADGYYRIDNHVVTSAAEVPARIGYARLPNSRVLRIEGTVPVGAPARMVTVGIDDPADYAAWTLRRMLVARGVKVSGAVRVRHRALSPADDPEQRGTAPATPPPTESAPLARLSPKPLIEDLIHTNKVSQNVHAELFLRRVSRLSGSGSIADGQARVTSLMTTAGVPRWAWDFADGSGMSSYNRVSPRATVGLLRYSVTQPWGEAWRSTFPVAGVDGTLKRRFVGTPLQGRLFAKTGSLDKANGLGGFLTTAKGKTLVFAAYAADMPQSGSATKALDAALQVVAAEN
ncbi:Penicillin-binding protein [Sphingomonas sp. EC-HK361]|uniref:D-alanyl-D-alanine carboxypeptidase/D-alanyl-D-alanine endopeptidase n=1 Tax=Sphingomonas sp. EC-HK361 TaxID=2038397 RepID=UPI0012565629|nr:D-alanyl-D-alanine carboxypeptidase/D-alanyl-D-alanine-endopeptidase [Sphingomonas sp. EC-HK361]VVT20062.1 Penicillin-binding protein [Sphingomonas sp. EC-HK361]